MHAYIYDGNGRFLLQKRSENKSFRPGQWEITMGHALSGETAIECLGREIKEELGVQLPMEDYSKVYRWIETGSHSLTVVFFVRADLDESALTLQKEEVTGLQWVTRDEILEFVEKMDYRTENYRTVVAEYIKNCI